MKLTNETVQIELKNGAVVSGTVIGAPEGAEACIPPLQSRAATPRALRRTHGFYDLPAARTSFPLITCCRLTARIAAGVDIAMNTHMKSVKLILKGKPAVSLDQMSVRGSNIRCASSVAGTQIVHVLMAHHATTRHTKSGKPAVLLTQMSGAHQTQAGLLGRLRARIAAQSAAHPQAVFSRGMISAAPTSHMQIRHRSSCSCSVTKACTVHMLLCGQELGNRWQRYSAAWSYAPVQIWKDPSLYALILLHHSGPMLSGVPPSGQWNAALRCLLLRRWVKT